MERLEQQIKDHKWFIFIKIVLIFISGVMTGVSIIMHSYGLQMILFAVCWVLLSGYALWMVFEEIRLLTQLNVIHEMQEMHQILADEITKTEEHIRKEEQ